MSEPTKVQPLQASTMGSLRQGSLAKRVALSAFAVYALLLQAFLAALAPADAFAFPGETYGVTCSLDGSNSGAPGRGSVHHHGLCCILACAAACAYVGTASATAAFPTRGPFPHRLRAHASAPGASAAQALFRCARSSRGHLIAPARPGFRAPHGRIFTASHSEAG